MLGLGGSCVATCASVSGPNMFSEIAELVTGMSWKNEAGDTTISPPFRSTTHLFL